MKNRTERIASLISITNGKPEWFNTTAKIKLAEQQRGLAWVGGADCRHVEATPGRLVRSKGGSWGRELGDRVCALNSAECVAAGLEPGPANL